jgi:glycosyltransferase involved in cell wall biosynthesis
MNRATAVLMPSRWEPFGLVALQAAQMARPVIASRIDGLREVVVHGQTGFLVPPEDPAALADAIAGLLGDAEQASAMGRAAQQRARETWPWISHVDAYEELYADALGRAR